MDECTTAYVFDEIRASEQARRPAITVMDSMIKAFARSVVTASEPTESDSPENHSLEYLSLVLSGIVDDNPKIMASSRTAQQDDVAAALRVACNRWARDSEVDEVLGMVGVDAMFLDGTILVGRAEVGRPGTSGTSAKQWPTVRRVPCRRVIEDPLIDSVDERRYAGHMWVRDKADILREAKDAASGWNAAIVRGLDADVGLSDLGRDVRGQAEAPKRGEVVGYDVWFPGKNLDGFRPEDGYNGTIYTVVKGHTDGEWVRAPRPYYGPRWGPYSRCLGMFVPGHSLTLSPLMATRRQQADVARLAMSISRSAASYKRVVLVDSSNPDLAKHLRDRPHDYIIACKGMNTKEIVVVEMGGVSAQQITAHQISKERLDRTSGLFDAQRGNVTGDGSATENSIADEASTRRMRRIKQRFDRGVRQMFRTVAWDMYHNDAIEFLLSREDAAEMGMPNGAKFLGGRRDDLGQVLGDGIGPDDVAFDDLDIDLEPYAAGRSTEREAAARVMQTVELIERLAPLVVALPYVEWADVFRKVGDAIGEPNFGEMLNVAKAMEMQAQAQAQGQAGGPGPSQPAVVVDTRPRLQMAGMAGGDGRAPQWGRSRGAKPRRHAAELAAGAGKGPGVSMPARSAIGGGAGPNPGGVGGGGY